MAHCIILHGDEICWKKTLHNIDERRSARLRERRSLKEPSIGTGTKQMVKPRNNEQQGSSRKNYGRGVIYLANSKRILVSNFVCVMLFEPEFGAFIKQTHIYTYFYPKGVEAMLHDMLLQNIAAQNHKSSCQLHGPTTYCGRSGS